MTKLEETNLQGTANIADDRVLGDVSFNVTTYSLLDKDVKYCHWSEGLNMVLEKNGVTIKLNSEEIQQVVNSLPRTIGGSY